MTMRLLSILSLVCILILSACKTSTEEKESWVLPGYRTDRVLPLFDGYWAYNTDVGMPGLEIGFPDPDMRHVYIEQGQIHNVVGFDEYQLITNDLKTLTSYILVRSKMFFPEGQKYTYEFQALRYSPPSKDDEEEDIVMFVKYGSYCNRIEANQDLWDHFDQQVFVPLMHSGGPCHYESDDTMWSGTLTYGRHW